MADWASVNGLRIASAKVVVPYYGAWTMEIMLPTDTAVDPRLSIVFGDLQMSGYAVRQGAYAGSWTITVVGGNGGWRKTIPAQSYNNSAGITKKLLLQDASSLVDEAVIVNNDAIVGTIFMREQGPASRILKQIAGSLWYMGFDGITYVSSVRDSSPITSEFTVIDADLAAGVYQIATDSLSQWTPGRTFTSPTVKLPVTIGSVSYTMADNGTLRALVQSADTNAAQQYRAPTSLDRSMRALRELIRNETTDITYAGFWEYVVQSSTSSTVDAVPLSSDAPLPDVVGAPLHPSIIGEHVTFTVGAICTIAFMNNDPSRPIVVGGDWNNAPSSIILANGNNGAMRVGDSVNCGYHVFTALGALDGAPGDTGQPGYYSGTTVGQAAAAARAATLGGGAYVVNMTGGKGSSGSSIVKIG